jgi:hypothetical protein
METAAGVDGDYYCCPDACYFRHSMKTLPIICTVEPVAHSLADHPNLLLYFGSHYWVVGCRSDR